MPGETNISTIYASNGPAVTVTIASYRGKIRNHLHNGRRGVVEGLGMANLGISGVPADYREAELKYKEGVYCHAKASGDLCRTTDSSSLCFICP